MRNRPSTIARSSDGGFVQAQQRDTFAYIREMSPVVTNEKTGTRHSRWLWESGWRREGRWRGTVPVPRIAQLYSMVKVAIAWVLPPPTLGVVW